MDNSSSNVPPQGSASASVALDYISSGLTILRNHLEGQTSAVIQPSHSRTGFGAPLVQHMTSTPVPGRQSATSVPTGTPRQGTSSALAELRNTFQPYSRAVNSRRVGSAGRPASSPRVQDRRPWSHKFCCLGLTTENQTPAPGRLAILQANGLGHATIFAERSTSEEQLRSWIAESFPRLRGIQFELLVSVGGGPGHGKPLRRINNGLPMLPVALLVQARIQSMIYIRPLDDLISDADMNSNVESSVSESSAAVSAVTAVEPSLPDLEDTTLEIFTSSQYLSGQYDTPACSLAEFRELIYSENPGEQLLAVQREAFAEQVLSQYKNPSFSLAKKPQVVFLGEAGRDVGALTKEYFWKGITSLSVEKLDGLPLFEGEMDHKVPACDAVLLRAGRFKDLGKFIGHALLHTGIGFIGLSNTVAEYLITASISADTPLAITQNDISDIFIRDIVRQVDEWIENGTQTVDAIQAIQEASSACQINLTVTVENLHFVKQQILYHHVLETRKPQLDSMKEGFLMSPAGQYAVSHARTLENSGISMIGFMDSIFPKYASTDIPASLLLEKLEIRGDEGDRVDSIVTNYILDLANEPGGIRSLLLCWTGWPFLPEDRLKVNVLENGQFKIRTCFAELDIPREMTSEDFRSCMGMALSFGLSGFGSV